MDSFLTMLVVLVVSAIATWMKKRAADGRGDSTSNPPQTPPSTSQPRPSPRPSSWEEELRRLLEGEKSPPPPVRPPAMRPPPPIVPSRPQPTYQAPPAVIKPVLVPSERRVVVPAPTPVFTPMPVPSRVEVSAAQLGALKESKQAHERASQLDKSVAEHIDRVPGQHVLATAVQRRAISPEITQAVSMFKSAQAARQAVMASLILGPPRAPEEFSPVY